MKHGEIVKLKILNAGIEAWVCDPSNVTASHLARELGMCHANILYHFPSKILKRSIAEYAVKIKHPKLVPILIASDDASVSSLKSVERIKFLQLLSNE
jgi:AcrR family transcriptional regulator